MDIKITNKDAYKIEILGFIIYIVFIILAMNFYAGGTKTDNNNPGYNFWYNTFSDTGRVEAHSGESNYISLIFFSIAYSTIAIVMIPFYIVFPRLFDKDTLEKKLSQIGLYLGIISSIGFLSVIPTPADILYGPHMLFAILAYVTLFFVMFFYSIAIYINGKMPKNIVYTFIVFTIIFFMFLMMTILSLSLDIRKLLTIGQKIGRFSILIGFSVLTFGAWKLENK